MIKVKPEISIAQISHFDDCLQTFGQRGTHLFLNLILLILYLWH